MRRLAPIIVLLPGLVSCGGSGASSTAAGSAEAAVGVAQAAAPRLPATPLDYVGYAVTTLPAHFRAPGPTGSPAAADNTPLSNPITNTGATLGRVLFYDKRLSVNDTVSCSSCHQQAHGFSDPSRFSRGFQGATGTRHAPGLTNAKFYQRGRFFWDERAPTLESQVLQPIQNPVEMGMDLTQLEKKLTAVPFYPPLFKAAFGTSEVNSTRISRALAQFVRSLVSYHAKYDLAFSTGTPGAPNFQAVFTPQEMQGLQLFGGPPQNGRSLHCDGCHTTTAQIGVNPENNGLDAVLTDVGAGGGRFKTPSLRNVAVRGPYMHDGRLPDLEAVIEHYNSGVQNSPDLSPRLRVGGNPTAPPQRLNLSPAEKDALKAFLATLTDQAFLADPRFSNPF